MTNRIREFLLSCKRIEFGKPKISRKERTFYRRFSKEIFSLCRSLPETAQTDAILFFLQYSGIRLGDKLDFFAHYYPPTWSIIYWLSRDSGPGSEPLKKADVPNAVTAQAMAMLLHSLDDHLTDQQVPVSPLTLFLRSQAWKIMDHAFRNLADGLPAGERTVRHFMNHYYSTTQDSKKPKSFDGYCDLFRSQMALGMIAPILLCMKMMGKSDFTKDIEISYGSFGVAWRLLDDLQDIGEDVKKRSISSVYYGLPEKIRAQWNHGSYGAQPEVNRFQNTLFNHIRQSNLIDKIKKRICVELDTASSIVQAHKLTGLAREFQCLALPLRRKGITRENSHGKPGTSPTAM